MLYQIHKHNVRIARFNYIIETALVITLESPGNHEDLTTPLIVTLCTLSLHDYIALYCDIVYTVTYFDDTVHCIVTLR